jgi:hypothetical protein
LQSSEIFDAESFFFGVMSGQAKNRPGCVVAFDRQLHR